MKNVFKHYIFIKVLPIIFLSLIALYGLVKVDMINTKALSPLGNTNENYKLINEKFGEDFSNFIKDNSYFKIYKESGNEILVRVGENNFIIKKESVLISKLEEVLKSLY